MPREAVRALVEREFPGAISLPLARDASTRRFFRVIGARSGALPVVLMDYGAPFSGETDDIRMSRVFRAASLPVAQILGVHPDPGCLVLQDLGERMLESELAMSELTSSPPVGLARAVELAARIHTEGTPALAVSERAAGPALDEERFRFEMAFFVENYVGRFKKITAGWEELRALLDDLASLAAETPRRVLCHRDYHSRNLMVVGEELAMVDIQDARWGPEGYDLASLLWDAYVDLADGWREPMIRLFVERVGHEQGGALRDRLDYVAAQRLIKALGTFGYQAEVAGNRRYLGAIPRTLLRLGRIFPRLDRLPALTKAWDRLGLPCPTR